MSADSNEKDVNPCSESRPNGINVENRTNDAVPPTDKWKKWKNWWYYYKWYVVCSCLVLGIAFDVIASALGLWQKEPDFQIAYVGRETLSEDSVLALKETFAAIGGDFNGDGEVVVTVNQYISGIPSAETDAAYYEYADEIALIGDITDCESYFFLTDDPVNLQRRFQILANADGSCPDETDYSAEGKTIAWSDSPALSDGETVSDPRLLELHLGRRCFYEDTSTDNREQCDELWDSIYNKEVCTK